MKELDPEDQELRNNVQKSIILTLKKQEKVVKEINLIEEEISLIEKELEHLQEQESEVLKKYL